MSRAGAWARWVRGRLRVRPSGDPGHDQDARDLAALREEFGAEWIIAHRSDGTWTAALCSADYPRVTTWAAATLRDELERRRGPPE